MTVPFNARTALRACVALLALGLPGCSDGTGSSDAPAGIRGASNGLRLEITGTPADVVPMGTTVQLAAEVRDAAGKPMNRKIAWLSRDTSRVRVSDAGLVTALLPGEARIVATSGSLADSATITVVVPVASVTVAPAAAYLYAGTALQ